MKKTGMLMTAVCLALSAAPAAAADDIGAGMGERLKRGFIDTLTGIVEWPIQTKKGWDRGVGFVANETGSKVTGVAIGLVFRGPSHAVGRIGSGLRELFGFWLPSPEDNKDVGTPLDAELAWEDGTPSSIFDPNLGEGIKPWGRKIARGLGNGLLGILEVPGQIVKGCKAGGAGNIAKGVVKGVWFFAGRTVYGVTDALSFPCPNHPDNPGYAFEEEWPWDALSDK